MLVRVTIRAGKGHVHRFWARVEKRMVKFTLYVPLKSDGDDKSYIRSDGATVLPEELVSNSLIVREQPARMNKKYGWLEVVG